MFDLVSLIKTAGYLGLFGIVFAESGLFVGFFLPGDSLLFTAGILAAQGFLNIWILALIVFLGAVLGDNFGYGFGRKVGPMIFKREDSIIFHKQNLERAKAFYEKHGKKTIILARFLPGVRTFAPILAGVGEMRYRTFVSYNIIGGLIWGVGMPFLGYFLGNTIPNIDRYLLPIVIFIIVVSVLPMIRHILKDPQDRARVKAGIKRIFKRK